MNNLIALIPARSGSKRIPHKNIKRLGKHPLLAYTIEVARQSGIFDEIYVSTDSAEIVDIARYYGAIAIIRPEKYALDNSPDIEWIQHVLRLFAYPPDYFAILRPTNPFRTPKMLQHAWDTYDKGCWLKGIEKATEHPFKMWVFDGKYQYQITSDVKNLHALPTQTLPTFWVQNGSIEIRPTDDLEPEEKQLFLMDDLQGYDLNSEKDWVYAEWLIANGKVKLIEIDKEPYEDNH